MTPKERAEFILNHNRTTVLMTINDEVVCLPYKVAKQVACSQASAILDAVYEQEGLDYWRDVKEEIYKL